MPRSTSLLALLLLFSLVRLHGQEVLFRGQFVPGESPSATGADARWAVQPGDTGMIEVVPTGVESRVRRPALRLESRSESSSGSRIPGVVGLFRAPSLGQGKLRMRLTMAAVPREEFSGMIVLRRELEPLFRLKLNERTGFIEGDANDQHWIPLFRWESGMPFTLEIIADVRRGEGRIRLEGEGPAKLLRLSRPDLVPDRLQISTGLMARSRGALEIYDVAVEALPATR